MFGSSLKTSLGSNLIIPDGRLLLETGVDFLLLEDGVSRLVFDNAGDIFFDDVVLLLPFDEADASTATVDLSQSSHLMTFAAGAEIDSAQSKWGNSLFVDGTSTGQITAPDHADWSFGSAPFTVEAWVRFNTGATISGTIASHYTTSGGRRSWNFKVVSTTSIQLVYSFDGGSGPPGISGTVPTILVNTWHHYAVTRDASNDLRLFFDGVLVGTKAIGASALHSSNAVLTLGNVAPPTADILAASGGAWIEDLRITKGVARYIEDFPAIGPHPAFGP